MVTAVTWLMLLTFEAGAQNIKFDDLSILTYRYPLRPLDKSIKSYSIMIQDLNANIPRDLLDTLDHAMMIPGYEKVKAGGDIQLELIVSRFSVTNKEAKDIPLEQKDGSVIHQYWYEIKYNLPAKLRLARGAQTINEFDLPGFFTTEFYPDDRGSMRSLQQAYDNDLYFLDKLKNKRLMDINDELRRDLFSNYGYGMVYETIEIAYVKDKKGEYEDLSRAMSLLHGAFTYANNKKDYQDDFFKGKISEAIAIYEKALSESNSDKKARINPFVTSMIQYDLALAYYGLHNFDAAAEWSTKIKTAGRSDGSVYNTLMRKIEEKRNRFIVNGILEGQSALPSLAPVVQPEIELKKFRDYIVDMAGDTLEVRFILPSKESMPQGDSLWLQDQIIVAKGSDNVTLRPSEINGYSYNGIFRETAVLLKDSRTSPFTYEKKFCKQTLKSAISLYDCYSVESSFRDPTIKIVVTYKWYKKNAELLPVSFLSFKKEVARLVEDYPELSEKVKAGGFKRNDFEEVVHEYNKWKKSK